MKKTIITLFLLLSAFYASAQNYLFDKGQSGFHMAGQWAKVDRSQILGLTLGNTWDGRFTLSVGGGREHTKGFNIISYSRKDITSYSIKPSVNYMVLKQSKGGMPLSLGLGTSYQYNWIEGKNNVTVGTVAFDLGVFRKIYMEKKAALIPGGYIGWGQSKVAYRDEPDPFKSSAVFGAFQTSILLNQFHITPAVHFTKEATSFYIQVGFIFPQPK
jgi:hypothetical protein